MTRRIFHIASILLLSFSTLCARAGDVIDRIVATVNGHAILESDWEEAVSYEAFMNGRPAERVSAEDRQAALARLIDRELLSEQVRFGRETVPDEQQIQDRIREIRKLYAGAESDPGWQAALRHSGIAEDRLKSHVAQQLTLMKSVEARLRPSVQVDAQSIEIYYKDTLVPQVKAAGAQPAPLAEVSPQIKELLAQQKLNELVTAWLNNLRSESQIRTATSGDKLR
jgi:hypothetical protein